MHGQKMTEAWQRVGVQLVRGGYALAVLLAACALFGSIGLQLWGAPGALDGPRPHRHHVYCEGAVWGLRRELQEAGLVLWRNERPALSRQDGYAAWQGRLAEVRRRCADLPAEGLLAEKLATLGARYAQLDAEAAEVRCGLAQELDFGLRFLSGAQGRRPHDNAP